MNPQPLFLLLIVLMTATITSAQTLPLPPVLPGTEVKIGDRLLRVAEGYEVSLAVPSHLAERPIAVSRDERGRLYVTDSGGMTERAEQQLAQKPHRIRRLEDTDGDGVYDRSTLFADRMMFPEGCQWFQGSLYVAAPPEIWKLTDDNDDGIADRREVWYDGRTLTGCGNDLHGPYLGLDGRLYWCKGAFAEQQHSLADGRQLITQSSHIFRSRPDGSEREVVLTGGMDNPVNVAFLNNGERFLSCTFFQNPEAGRRDGLIHAIYGGVYGKKHPSIYAHPMTGDVMPVLCHQGAAAPCGLIAGSEQLFQGGHDQSLFACYFNLHKVVRHQLVPDGPTYQTVDTDLLACDHPDFHPTDVFEDADGSLLVVDTGGWYKVCCPTSQLAKPDVLGAIYRIRRRGSNSPADPLGLQLPWTDNVSPGELAARLADPRLFVQRRATAGLRLLKSAALEPLTATLRNSPDAAVRRRALWTLAGIDLPEAGSLASTALTDSNPAVRQSAAHVVSLFRHQPALDSLLKMAAADEAGPARAAIEAIGRLKQPAAATALFDLISSLPPGRIDSTGAPFDASARIREHQLIYALFEIGDSGAIRRGLQLSNASAIRASLTALECLPGSQLTPQDVIPRMTHPSSAVRAAAVWIARRHLDWGTPLAEFLDTNLQQASKLPESQREVLVQLLSSLLSAPPVQALTLDILRNAAAVDATSQPERLNIILESIAAGGLTAAPAGWLESIAALLPATSETALPALLNAARSLPQPKEGHAALRQSLLTLARRPSLPAELRLQALELAGPGIPLSPDVFSLLKSNLNPDLPLQQRTSAASRLASASLTEDQVQELIEVAAIVGPMELPRLLPAFEQHPSESRGLALVAALPDSSGLRGLRTDLLQPLFARYPASVQSAAQPLLKLINASAEEQTAQLEQLLTSLPSGDIRRGHEVFMSRRAACNTCHKLGYGGGQLGPDLTSIGRVRNRRDLLEAIIFPAASLVRGYEPVSIEMEDGQVHSGIIKGEDATEVVLAPDAVRTLHLSRTSITSIQPSTVSPMPNGYATLLTNQELADLLEFLLTNQR
ncbi:MAG: PVC-type heme-binding CxxCH protein [Planctomycetaceae bacterium]